MRAACTALECSAARFNHMVTCAGLTCLWAGTHNNKGQTAQPSEPEAPVTGDAGALQPDEASLRGSSMEVSCPAKSADGERIATANLGKPICLAKSQRASGTFISLAQYQHRADRVAGTVRLEAGCCAYVKCSATRTPDSAGINRAGSEGARPLSKTHVLPVSQESEPETINILDKETQGILRKGHYNFTRCIAYQPSHYFLVSCLTTYKSANRLSLNDRGLSMSG